jgi:DEAD/DEAH box helicase domain-containing protein
MVELERSRAVTYRRERWFFTGHGYPAEEVGLRAISASRYAILDESRDYRLLEEMEATLVPTRIYPGAIYLHQGESYLIKRLDLDSRLAIAAPARVDYYTEPRQVSETSITQTWRQEAFSTAQAFLGELHVVDQVLAFRKLQEYTGTVLGIEALELPPSVFDTVGLWFTVSQRIVARVETMGMDFAGGLHALEHACIAMLPLFAMCDRADIGGLSTPLHPNTGEATVFVFDGYPGGMGIAEKGYELLVELWQATLHAVRDCPCEEGCPSCIQSPKCGNNNEHLDKQAAIAILEILTLGCS